MCVFYNVSIVLKMINHLMYTAVRCLLKVKSGYISKTILRNTENSTFQLSHSHGKNIHFKACTEIIKYKV